MSPYFAFAFAYYLDCPSCLPWYLSLQSPVYITRTSLGLLSRTVYKPILLHLRYPAINPKNHHCVLTPFQIWSPQLQPLNLPLLRLSLGTAHRLVQTVALRQRRFGDVTPRETPFATRAVSSSASSSYRFAVYRPVPSVRLGRVLRCSAKCVSSARHSALFLSCTTSPCIHSFVIPH